ncbi:valine--tRNA ligase [Chloroflexota bacterium]
MTQKQLAKAYDPKQTESKWYKFWMDNGYFTPKIDPNKKPFVIIMPPPNITGELHQGHALVVAIEDTMTRWHRMKGEPALWLPGVDHASIATQFVVQKTLIEEGTSREKLGKEKFLERTWQWANEHRHKITEQHKKLGVSCDWSRECFTMDEGPNLAVRTTFYNLYKKGLIYKSERMINWCPSCATALSDLEVEHETHESKLYYVRYPLADDKNEYITVATTRPETILGDTAVAVNPDDKRYAKLIGKTVLLPVVNRVIPIIADEAVDPAFGTGAVKITPAHDPVDFDVAQRNNLPLINIMNQDATMNENAGPYAGMDRFNCRKQLLADLEKKGLLVKIDPYQHSVGHCQRCKTIAEPAVSEQWFMSMESLAKPAIEAVTSGKIKIIPEHFTKVYLNWMENIKDWCISRQLWWGHRIPVWYCKDCNEVIVSIDTPNSCNKCKSSKLEQDPDVLDTWFSSGLWPHSTLGWPNDTEDFKYFYPTTVMETAYDILFFWVARMIMMGIENTGQIPFDTVYFHGLVRDAKGEKMSKTKGNVINPLSTIDQYGTDALRFALSTGNTPGSDMKLTTQRLESSRNFANKLWNASRFVLSNITSIDENEYRTYLKGIAQAPTEDRWIISRLNTLITNVNRLVEDFQFGEAQREIYDFLWNEYCDWYIELAKIRLRDDNAKSPIPVLIHVLETALRLLHPFMPFITEELWQALTDIAGFLKNVDSIIIAEYPTKTGATDAGAEQEIEAVINTIRSVRNARAHNKIPPSQITETVVISGMAPLFQSQSTAITKLSRSEVTVVTVRDDIPESMKAADAGIVDVPYEGVEVITRARIDTNIEKQRLIKESGECRLYIGRIESKLNDPNFVNKAPAHVVEKQRQQLNENKEKLSKLEEQLKKLQ